MNQLREFVRVQEMPSKQATPSAASIDRQSVKTAGQGGDGGKKINGRKRHVSVDILGLPRVIIMTGADVDDGVGAPQVLQKLGTEDDPRLAIIWADNKYHHHALYEWIETESTGSWDLEITHQPEESKGFVPWVKRWVVERTFSGFGRCRRHSKDSEYRTDSSEPMLCISAIKLMLEKLKPSQAYPPFQCHATT